MAVELGELIHATRMRAEPVAAIVSSARPATSAYASFVSSGGPAQTQQLEVVQTDFPPLGGDPLSRPPSWLKDDSVVRPDPPAPRRPVVSASSVAASWLIPYGLPIGAGLVGLAIVWWLWKDGSK